MTERVIYTPYIFISHLHQDAKIAGVLRLHLELWGIPRENVFQSSEAGAGPIVGDDLALELKRSVAKSNLVLLIYTLPSHDWSYPMWEGGLAVDPAKAHYTRVVVFQCGVDKPRPFSNNVLSEVTPEGIRDFTERFHWREGFFPNQPAYSPNTHIKVIEKRSKDLYEALKEVIPKRREKEVRRWPFLKLLVSAKAVQEILKKEREKDAERDVPKILREDAVILEVENDPLSQFGLFAFDPGIKFDEVVNRWSLEFEDHFQEKPDTEWASGLSLGIWRGIRNTPPQPISKAPLRSLPNDDRYHLIVTAIKKLDSDAAEISILMLRASPEPIAQ